MGEEGEEHDVRGNGVHYGKFEVLTTNSEVESNVVVKNWFRIKGKRMGKSVNGAFVLYIGADVACGYG